MKTYIVRTKLEVTVACKVQARSKKSAVKQANLQFADGPTGFYSGNYDLDRPGMIGWDNNREDEECWFEDFECGELFMNGEASEEDEET